MGNEPKSGSIERRNVPADTTKADIGRTVKEMATAKPGTMGRDPTQPPGKTERGKPDRLRDTPRGTTEKGEGEKMHDMITQSQKLTEYLTFVERKRHTVGDGGFRVNYVPEMAFDFQREIIERAVRKGRLALEKWTDRDGKEQVTLDVQATEMQFISAPDNRGDAWEAPEDRY